jgi:sporulation protein YtfJ
MADNTVQNTLGSIMENLKTMVDSNSVVGDPITTPDGTTIIPVSKISYGFGSGGGNLASKTASGGMGAGGGGGITVTPVAFLTVKDGVVKMTQVEPFISSVDRVIEKMPDMMDKVGSFLDDKKEERAAKKAEKKAEKEAAKALKKQENSQN